MEKYLKLQSGYTPQSVGISSQVADDIRNSLPFRPKAQFYLNLPTQKHIYFVLFCLTAKPTLTVTLHKIFSEFDKQTQDCLTKQFLMRNQKRRKINSAWQLEQLARKLNKNNLLIGQCSNKFSKPETQYFVKELQKQHKVLIVTNEEQRVQNYQQKDRDIFFLTQSGLKQQVFMAAFSPKTPKGRLKVIKQAYGVEMPYDYAETKRCKLKMVSSVLLFTLILITFIFFVLRIEMSYSQSTNRIENLKNALLGQIDQP